MDTINKRKAREYDSPLLASLLAEITPEEHARTQNQMMMSAHIADAIEAKGWTKKTFAEKIGQSPSVITKWLSGSHNFTLDTLTDIQRVLGIQLLCVEEIKPEVQLITKVVYTPIYISDNRQSKNKNSVLVTSNNSNWQQPFGTA